MILGRVAFSVVICPVGGTWGPVVSKLALGVTASDPIKSHIHSLSFLGDNGLIGEPIYCGVVSLDGGLRLWPFNLFQCLSERNHFLGCNEYPS